MSRPKVDSTQRLSVSQLVRPPILSICPNANLSLQGTNYTDRDDPIRGKRFVDLLNCIMLGQKVDETEEILNNKCTIIRTKMTLTGEKLMQNKLVFFCC